MRHLTHKAHAVRIVFVFFVVFIVVWINSCRKDIAQSKQSVVSKTLTTQGLSLAQLQNAYAKGIKGAGLKTNDVSQQAVANIIGTLNVDWSSYTLQQFPDSTQVIEFPMPDDSALIAPSDSIQTGNNKYRSKTCAVFILHKDTITMDFFMKTIEDLNNPNYQSVIDQQHYLNTAATFNGEIMYFTLNRQFINGYKWQNGNITKALSIGTTQSVQQQNQSIKTKLKVNVLYNCVEDTYEIVDITTVTTPYGSTTTVTPTGTSITIITCDVSDGGTSTSGGVSGGGSPIPPPCTTGSGGTVTSSVQSGRLIINVTTGGGGSSGGTTTTTTNPCITNPTPPIPVPPPPPDPCTQASTLANNQAFINKMNYLASIQNTPGETTDLMESNGTFNQQVSTVNGGADQTFPLSYFNGSIGFLHNHGNGPGIISVFTANDIASLNAIVTQGNVSNPSAYTYGLVNQHGQSYLLAISNMSNFNTWASTYASNGAPNNIFLSLYNNLVSSTNSDASNESNLATLLATTNSGLTLMKGNTTNTVWSQVVRNSDGTVSIIQCPTN